MLLYVFHQDNLKLLKLFKLITDKMFFNNVIE